MLNSTERWLAKSKLKERIKAEDRWKQFVTDRSKFAKQMGGIPMWVAAIGLCLKDYRPLDGSPPEYGADDFADVMAKVVGRPLTPGSDALPAEEAERMRVTAAATVNRGLRGSTRTELEWEKLRRKVYRVQRLGRLRAGTDETSVVRWCWENAETPPHDLDPFDVPGTGAIKLLKTIQTDSRAYDDFVKNCFTKLLSKGLESDYSGGPGEDGRTQLRVMDRLDEIDVGDDDDTIARKLTPNASDEDGDDEDLFDDIDFEEAFSGPDAGAQRPQGQSGLPPQGVEGGAGL
jgi:hypothetical protein